MKVNIIDAIMGAGKTTSAINYIKEHGEEKNFIYITPYLTEVERIERECAFLQPIKYTESTPKIVDLKNLLLKERNIVTTHSMFQHFDDEIIRLCQAQGYVLFMDEVADVVEPYPITKKDLEVLLKEYVDVKEDNTMVWRGSMTEKFAQEKRLCELGCLALYQGSALLWMFPVKVFEAFSEIYILTYMFDAQIQKYYYDYYGIEYEYLYITPDYHFTEEPQEYTSKYDYQSLVTIVQDVKLNRIGDTNYSLGKQWYKNNSGGALMQKLKNNIYNFCRNKLLPNGDKPSSSDILWTTFSDFKNELAGKGYTKGFTAINLRATNEYKDRSVVAYPVNRFMNPVIKNFFTLKDITVQEDRYALSEMLQFIWRSAIREGKGITVYIPSLRMRTLLINWMEAVK